MSTQSQINANRQNAQASTGPRTPEGKAASSANATKHGLSAGFRVLDNENREEFDELIADYHATFKPANTQERFLVEEMAQSRWRLARARRLEAQLIQDLVARRGSDDADAMMVAAFRNDTATALNTLQRYAAAVQRAAFRAQQQLLELRKTEARAARAAADKTNPIPPRARTPPRAARRPRFPSYKTNPIPPELPLTTADARRHTKPPPPFHHRGRTGHCELDQNSQSGGRSGWEHDATSQTAQRGRRVASRRASKHPYE
jgi:hypothetical protein